MSEAGIEGVSASIRSVSSPARSSASGPLRIGKLTLRARATAVSVAALAALLLGPLAGKGFAGTYIASDCGAGNSYSAAQPAEYGHHFYGIANTCAGGSGLDISLPQAYWAWGYARWTVTAPPGTHIINVSGAQQGVDADNWYVQLSACSPSACGPNVYVSGDGYWRIFGTPPGYYSNWWVQLICGAASCYGSLQAGAHVRDVTMTMSDDVAPSVSFVAPTSQEAEQDLLNGQVQRGTARLGVAPRDVGAGLTSTWVLVNDQEVTRQNYGCGGPPMAPCPADAGTADYQLDTQTPPFHDGANTVQVCAADYGAPPNVTCSQKRVVQVDNSCTPSSVPGGSDLSAAFRRSKSSTVSVRAGQGAQLTGQLTDASGTPVQGASLCVKEGVAGDPLDAVGTLRTNSLGRYQYNVAPGPDRNLLVGYRVNRRQIARDARFNSHAKPKLRLSPKRKTRNGKRLRMYGSIPGPRNDGRIVILQASAVHSRRWLTFRKAVTDQHGNFTASYRFTGTFRTVKYRFRSVVPPQNGYPYTGAGVSRIKEIKVIGRPLPHVRSGR